MSATRERARAADGEAAFEAWRGKVADIVLFLFALSAFPQLFAWILGYHPAAKHEVIFTAAVVLLVILVRLARRRPPSARVWIMLLIPYLVSIQGLVWYTGAMARVWLAGAPIFALILAGPRSAFVAAAASIGLIGLHAVGTLTGVAQAWRVPGFDENDPGVVVSRAIMWVAFFLPFLELIRRVHLFHLKTLAAERATSARLEDELTHRRAAHEALSQAAAERAHLEREITRVGDEERRRLGQDLHDGVNQQLAVALLRCRSLEERLDADYPEGAAEACDLGALLESTMDEVHEVARSLSPVEMEPDALGPALGALARRTAGSFGIRCEFRESGAVRLDNREKTLDLYRIAQEAVINAGKHAHAHRVAMSLERSDGHVLLTVEDDGQGLGEPAAKRRDGLGMRIMAFRANRIGGSLALEKPRHGGTRVVCQIPVGADDDG